jgi:hypothetical protein
MNESINLEKKRMSDDHVLGLKLHWQLSRKPRKIHFLFDFLRPRLTTLFLRFVSTGERKVIMFYPSRKTVFL